MRHGFTAAMVALAGVLIFSLPAVAQAPQSQANQAFAVDLLTDTIVGDGGPAPKRDLSGTWAGPGSTDAIPREQRPSGPR